MKKNKTDEDRGRRIKVVPLGGWYILIGIILLLAGVTVWSIFGTIREDITIEGKLVDERFLKAQHCSVRETLPIIARTPKKY
jgi:hypothetical protein